jgi:hypothetical protein
LPEKAGVETFETGVASKCHADTITSAFSGLPKADVRRRLANVLKTDETRAEQIDTTHGRELRFWALTDVGFRWALTTTSVPSTFELFGEAPQIVLPPFSDGLRKAITSD